MPNLVINQPRQRPPHGSPPALSSPPGEALAVPVPDARVVETDVAARPHGALALPGFVAAQPTGASLALLADGGSAAAAAKPPGTPARGPIGESDGDLDGEPCTPEELDKLIALAGGRKGVDVTPEAATTGRDTATDKSKGVKTTKKKPAAAPMATCKAKVKAACKAKCKAKGKAPIKTSVPAKLLGCGKCRGSPKGCGQCRDPGFNGRRFQRA